MNIETPAIGTECVCPVCQKQFKYTVDHMYIVKGGFTCSWKCFLEDAKLYTKESPKTEGKSKKKAAVKKPVVQYTRPTNVTTIELVTETDEKAVETLKAMIGGTATCATIVESKDVSSTTKVMAAIEKSKREIPVEQKLKQVKLW